MTRWVAPSPDVKYGGGFIREQRASQNVTALPGVAGPSAAPAAVHPLHPSGPLFWAGLFVAASVGLMAYSTTVRVGPVSAGVTIGK